MFLGCCYKGVHKLASILLFLFFVKKNRPQGALEEEKRKLNELADELDRVGEQLTRELAAGHRRTPSVKAEFRNLKKLVRNVSRQYQRLKRLLGQHGGNGNKDGEPVGA